MKSPATTSLVRLYFVFCACALLASCEEPFTAPLPPVHTVNAQSKKIECSTFLQAYQNYDYFFFTFPGTPPTLGLNCNLINASEVRSVSLSNLGPVHTVTNGGSDFNVVASRLTKKEIAGFITAVKQESGFATIESKSSDYYINFKVIDTAPAFDSLTGPSQNLVVTLTATKKTGNVESSASIRTNPCPPCTK